MRISDWSSDVCSSDLMVFPIAFRADLIAGLPKSRTLRFCALEYRERWNAGCGCPWGEIKEERSEEHTSELQSLMRISYAVFCLKKKKQKQITEVRSSSMSYISNINTTNKRPMSTKQHSRR